MAQALNNGAAPLFQGAYGPEFNEEKYPKDTNDNDPATTMLPWRKYIFVNEDGEEYIPKEEDFPDRHPFDYHDHSGENLERPLSSSPTFSSSSSFEVPPIGSRRRRRPPSSSSSSSSSSYFSTSLSSSSSLATFSSNTYSPHTCQTKNKKSCKKIPKCSHHKSQSSKKTCKTFPKKPKKLCKNRQIVSTSDEEDYSYSEVPPIDSKRRSQPQSSLSSSSSLSSLGSSSSSTSFTIQQQPILKIREQGGAFVKPQWFIKFIKFIRFIKFVKFVKFVNFIYYSTTTYIEN